MPLNVLCEQSGTDGPATASASRFAGTSIQRLLIPSTRSRCWRLVLALISGGCSWSRCNCCGSSLSFEDRQIETYANSSTFLRDRRSTMSQPGVNPPEVLRSPTVTFVTGTIRGGKDRLRKCMAAPPHFLGIVDLRRKRKDGWISRSRTESCKREFGFWRADLPC